MQVYVNYPYPHITVHKNDACQQVRLLQKDVQRQYTVRPENLEMVVAEFPGEKFVFGSRREFNVDDLWFDISLGSSAQDLEFVHRFQAMIGQRYERLSHAPISIHCE